MRSSELEVRTTPDGAVVVRPHGAMSLDDASELRQVLVHAVRRIRPNTLILDLGDVPEVDSINLGTLVAACELGDDSEVPVFLQNPSPVLAEQLAAAGVPRRQVRAGP